MKNDAYSEDIKPPKLSSEGRERNDTTIHVALCEGATGFILGEGTNDNNRTINRPTSSLGSSPDTSIAWISAYKDLWNW